MDISNGWTMAIIMVTVVCFALEVSLLAAGEGGLVGVVAGIGIATVVVILTFSGVGATHHTHPQAHTQAHTTAYVQHQSSHRSQGG